MAQLNDQTIASSYEQLLHVNRDGGGDSGNLVTVYDGDNDTEFALQISNAGIASTGTLAVTGASTLSSTLTVAGTSQLNSTLTVGVDDTGYDVKFFGATSGSYMHWDENIDTLVLGVGSKMVMGNTSATTILQVETPVEADGVSNVVSASFGKVENYSHYIDVICGNFQNRYAGIAFSQQISKTSSSTNHFAMVRGKITSGDAATEITGSLELLYNAGDALTVGATLTDAGKFGIGTGSPTAKLAVTGPDASGQPCIHMSQLDIDQPFFNLDTTVSGSGTSNAIITDTTTDNAKYGAMMISIGGVKKWIRIYDGPS